MYKRQVPEVEALGVLYRSRTLPGDGGRPRSNFIPATHKILVKKDGVHRDGLGDGNRRIEVDVLYGVEKCDAFFHRPLEGLST